ncbi:putative membrane protein [Anaerofustis stercorihominis DSM 17244]|uniref:Membrane protein n=1 Tax=Anaerofustis stercorihominis DSM 17244 TaxID=445971 RepID=B1CBU8_9FIRM|nr:DMT family transporter [Anaerofustis stercorihominis]EDS71745.1 putative membrane protein [Anaerofustis stercorihominis DSM 17244]
MNKTKETFLTKPIVICLLASICCILWGSAFPSIKIGYKLFNIASADTASQMLFAGLRFTLAGIITIIIGSIISKKLLIPKKESYKSIFKLSMVQTVLQYVCFYVGLANTTGVKASIIEASNVFLAILIPSLMLKHENLTIKKMLGCIIGFMGVVIINLNGASLDINMKLSGEGLIFMSAVMYALSSILVKEYSKNEQPVVLSGYQFILGGIVMILIGIFTGGKVSGFNLNSTLLLIYMALISAVAYSLWSILLKYNPVGKVAVFGFLNPVCGVILSAVLLKEGNVFNILGMISLILVCIGIYMVNRE